MALRKNLLTTVVCLACNIAGAQIFINEICPANADILYDTTFYEFNPWVELYNSGETAVNLKDYYLSDDSQAPTKWRIPVDVFVEAKGYIILWCDKQDTWRHANFSLDTDGEQIILSDPAGILLDQIVFPEQFLNVSYGRLSDGSNDINYISKATPGAANIGVALGTELEALTVSPQSGVYSSAQSVSLLHAASDAAIRYTTDGSEPNEQSSVYAGAIEIASTTVIKAKAFRSGSLPSETLVSTYIISDREFSLPVVSLSLAPAYLYDETIGIYVAGTNGIPGRGSINAVNWNHNWYRHADFELFHFGEKVYDHAVDMRIYGNFSRVRPQKSFAIKARDKYGKSTLKHKFFPLKNFTEVGGFTLRNSGTDWNITHFRDALMHRIPVGQMDLDFSDYQPAVLFLNGQYWGIQNFRERLEEDYFSSNFNVSEDNLELLESSRTELIGTNEFYTNYRDSLYRDVDRKDPNTIRFIERNIDVQNFINYNVHNIYCANTDWPGNNVKFWRRESDNGKFRWLLYDMDTGFAIETDHPTLEWATAPDSDNGANRPSSTQHLRDLLENPVFRNRFIQTMLTAIQTTYAPDRVISLIDEFQDRLKTEMPYHKQKWGGSMNNWNAKVQYLRDFAMQRNTFMLQHTIDFFGLDNPIKFDVTANPPAGGKFELNGVASDQPLDDAVFFQGAMYKATAIPAKGYAFDHWKVHAKASVASTPIPYKSTWKYFDKGSLPAANWKEIGYDDGSWTSSAGEFGYGDGDEGTVVGYGPDRLNKYPTTYFRKTFTVDKEIVQNIIASVIFDDGVVVYVNGVEVYRRSMPLGPIAHETLASQSTENSSGTFVVDAGLLVDGENVIAAEVHQNVANSSDLSFDLSLTLRETGEFESTTVELPVVEGVAYSDVTLEANFVQVNGVVINELSASNSIVRDEANQADDWIELFNTGDKPIDLSNLYVTDDLNNKKKFRIPAQSSGMIMQPGEYKLLWADADLAQGMNHVDFKLSEEGEAVGIYQMVNDQLITIDEVVFSSQPQNYSWARIPNGTGPFTLVSTPTPGAENSTSVVGIEDPSSSIHLYPNPTDGLLEIKSPYVVQRSDVFDAMGRLIMTSSGGERVINLQSLDRGIYVIRISSGGRIVTKRIVKK